MKDLKCLLLGKDWLSRIVRIGLILILIIIPLRFNYMLTWSRGDSMIPSYKDGQIMVMEKQSSDWQPERYDVIIAKYGDQLIVKRIVGLPGEIIEVIDGLIYVQGQLRNIFKGKIMRATMPHTQLPETIPLDYFWVIGDNRELSVFGLIPRKDIIGKVIN